MSDREQVPSPSSMCTRCSKVKPRTLEHWRPMPRGRDGMEPHICKACRLEERRLRRKLQSPLETKERAGKLKLCVDCGSLPHRVPGIRCRRCGLRHGEPPVIEIPLRRFA